MKKLLSIALAIILVLGLTVVAFAAPDKINGVAKPIDTNNSPNLYNIKPGDKVQYPLTADMFTWTSGTAGATGVSVTQSEIQAAGVKTVLSGTTSNIVKSTSIKYPNKKDAVVEVEFVKPLVSNTEKNFEFSLYLQVSRREPNSRIIMIGTLANPTVPVHSSTDYADLAGGAVLEAKASVRNVEIDLGNGVILVTNVYSGQSYYGNSDDEITVADDAFISKNPSVTDVLHLQTIGLNRTGKYVNLSSYSNRFVYNSKGVYLGKSADFVEYSDTYYLASKDLGNVSTGGGIPGTVKPEPPTTVKPPTGGGTSTSGTIESAEAKTLMAAAVKTAKAKGNKTATVVAKSKAGVTAEALRSMSSTAANSGLKSSLQADTLSSGTIVGRVYINPANASKLSGTIQLGLHTNNSRVTKTFNSFNKNFKNDIVVVSFDQDNSFGMSVNVAVKANLSNINKNNLYFYSYNRAANQYFRIKSPGAWIDNTGYLRFTTTLAGDIIISDGPLAK